MFAALTKQPLAGAIAELKLEAGLHFDELGEARYLSERAQNQELQVIWREGQARLRSGVTPSTRGLFQDLGCIQGDPSLVSLWPMIGVLRAEDLDDHLIRKEDRGVLKRLGKYNALAMPTWEFSRIVGFWLVQPASDLHNGAEFLQVYGDLTMHALSNAQSLRIGQEVAFLTNDPRLAIRFMARQAMDLNGVQIPFCIPEGYHHAHEHFANQRQIWLAVEAPGRSMVDAFKRAIRMNAVDTVEPWELSYQPLTEFPKGKLITADTIMTQLVNKAAPTGKALGTYLLRQKEAEAVRMANTLSLTTSERNAVLHHFQGEDAAQLERILERGPVTNVIEFDGKRVHEDAQGWTVDGKVICNVVVRFAEQITNEQTGEIVLLGTLAFERKLVPFRVEKTVLRADFVKWLVALVERHGGWPRTNTSWNKRLLDVAREFSKDTMRKTSGAQRFGWDDKKTLFTRRFTLDPKGYTRVALSIDGPELKVPTPLAASEWDAFGDQGFCLTALALLGNLVRTANGLPGYGLLLPAARHLVDRIGDALALPIEENPSNTRVSEAARLPVPVVAQWSDERLAEVIRLPGAKHLLASVDQRSFDLLAADPAFLRLPVGSIADYDALRWVWLVLPGLLTWSPDEAAFYTQLAKLVAKDVGRNRPNHLLMSAASQLDARRVADGNAGTVVMQLLRRLADRGALPIVADGDVVRVQLADVRTAMTAPLLPPVDLKRLTEQLRDGSMLMGSSATEWQLNAVVWGLVATYSRTA